MKRRTTVAVVAAAALVVLSAWLLARFRGSASLPEVSSTARTSHASAALQVAQLQAPRPTLANGLPAGGAPSSAASGTSAVAVTVLPSNPSRIAAEIKDFRNPAARRHAVEFLRKREARERKLAAEKSREGDWPDGVDRANLVEIRNGRVYVRGTLNREAAISTAADRVRQTPPYSLDGAGTTVGVWDQGLVRPTHVEFGGRVTTRNAAVNVNHSTHVGGTIGASGVDDRARGMAPAVRIDSYDWDYDAAEMAEAAMAAPGETNRIPLSNHSYGFETGWSGLTWYGTWGEREADGFGQYETYSAILDSVCYAAPYYLPFKAAGNDRNEGAPLAGQSFSYYDDGWKTQPYNPATDPLSDNWDAGGYDTIPYESNAKNVMTVGAVNDAVSGGSRSLADATMASFSSWGPTDDGRVKPDIVANGANLYSCSSLSDTSYTTMSGTSMATPNAMGSSVLLAQCYGQLHPGGAMRSSMLKGLIIHSADDLGAPGPDYRFGWGLMNTLAAVEHIRHAAAWTNALRMTEGLLAPDADVQEFAFTWDHVSLIRITLCWTDPPGEVRMTLDDRVPVLVNDLDVRLIAPDGTVLMPYVLNVTNPAAAATNGDNIVDNVEQINVPAPQPGLYRVRLSAKSLSSGAAQPYALLVGGSAAFPRIDHQPLQNTIDDVNPIDVEADVTSEWPLDTNRVTLAWNTTGPDTPFATNVMQNVAGAHFIAQIPPQSQGTTVFYYLQVATANDLVAILPTAAPSTLFQFSIVEQVSLTVAGQASEAGLVQPGYGVSLYPSGITVNAEAELFTSVSNHTRYTCAGWQGDGSVPASGSSNRVSVVLRQDSTLTWVWEAAYELVQTSLPAGLIETSTWWSAGAPASTVVAPDAVGEGVDRQRFCMWIDGNDARLPDAVSEAQNPATGIAMTQFQTASAFYVPESLDEDGDGLPDWWELRYFGAGGCLPNMDDDGDGYSNIKEYEDGANPRDPASFPCGPSIAHTPLSGLQTTPSPWQVAAVVTDNNAVRDVFLEWSRNGGAWQRLAMAAGAATNSFVGTVPSSAVTGDRVDYRILALDRSGLAGLNGPYRIDVRYARMAAIPIDFGTIELSDDSVRLMAIKVHNVGHSDLAWTLVPEAQGFCDGAEGGTNRWTHGGTNDAWHVSARHAHSGSNAWYFGSDVTGGYPDSSKASLESHALLAPSGCKLVFWHKLQTEDLKSASQAWDGGIVEVSTNGGVTYDQVAPVGGYPYVIYGHSASAFTNGTPCFAGSNDWQRAEFDLASYAGLEVRIRFTFGSDGLEVQEGWYLDDIQLQPYSGDISWISVSAGQSSGVTASQKMSTAVFSVSTVPLEPEETRRGFLRLTGNDPVGPVLRIPIALHNSSHLIMASSAGSGSISPSGRVVVAAGALAGFALAAEPYYRIAEVLTNGAHAGGPYDGSPSSFVWSNIVASGSLHVEFVPILATNNVPQFWLAGYGTTGNFDAAAMSDLDGDGALTWEEYVAGTEPTNAESVFKVEACDPVGTNSGFVVTADPDTGELSTQTIFRATGLALRWRSASNRWYRVVGQTDFDHPGVVRATGVPATPPQNVYIVPADAAPAQIYHIEAELTP